MGPRLASIQKKDQWFVLEDELSAYFIQTLEELSVPFDEKSSKDMAYLSQKLYSSNRVNTRVDIGDLVDIFFEELDDDHPQGSPASIYHQVAKLPVRAFVNTTFDSSIVKALRAAGKRPQFYYYNFALLDGSWRQIGKHNAPKINIDEISIESPLVFNLFGVREEVESLVVTQMDQVDYIKNVLGGEPPLPDALLSFFHTQNKSCLFLGYDFNNWQYRMILNSLNLRESGIHFASTGKDQVPSQVNQDFYQDINSFGFVFSDKEAPEFVKDLSSRVVEEKEVQQAKIHVIYTVEDQAYWKELEKHLSPIKEFKITDSGMIAATAKRSEAIQKWIAEADHILFLVSPDFLVNEDIRAIEMEQVIAKSKANPKVKVMPVLLKPSLWREEEAYWPLIPLPENEEPVTNASHWGDEDKAYFEIVQTLKNRIL